MKVLLTGGNGLLGKCFARELTAKGYDFTIVGHNDLSNNAVKADISSYEQISTILDTDNYTHIINCAADRDPESCLYNPVKAYSINSAGVENLARAANNYTLALIHISTDYVFDGENPPYSESAHTNPVNAYGRSKLAGELAACTAAEHLVLRIPALFRADSTDPRNLLSKIDKELSDGNTITLDSNASRFYTLADDVAHAGIELIEKSVHGIVHLSASERSTKAEFARIFARSRGYDESLILEQKIPTDSTEKRPVDSQLDTSYFQSISDYTFSGPTTALAR